MAAHLFTIPTERLILREWEVSDADDFAAMNADAAVMADLGGPIDRAASDEKLERFRRSFAVDAVTRWVVTSHTGEFLGYCGLVLQPGDDHPLGQHHEIGWRLRSEVWGHRYAPEAATAALADAFERVGCREVFAYTSPSNRRSQSVMRSLGLERRVDLDFTRHYDDVGQWQAMVWSTTSASSAGDGVRRD